MNTDPRAVLEELVSCASPHDPGRNKSNEGRWVTINAPRELFDRARALCATPAAPTEAVPVEAQWQEAIDLLRWARGKLFRIAWTKQEDAHMMDRLNDAVSEDERD